MNFNSFRFVLLFSIIVLLNSCLETTDTTVLSSDASFVSLTLAKNDSVKLAVFTLVGDTIVNLDSLPFNTQVDSVYPTFSFKSTSGAKLYLGPNEDSVILTGNDTINFSIQPIRIRNCASDKKTYSKDLFIKVNVHKVQPELYVWKNLGETLNPQSANNQKTIMRNDSMFYYLNDGSTANVYISKDGISWNSKIITGFPVNTPIDDMIQFNGKFYVTRDVNNIYSSSNGLNWAKLAVTTFNFKSLLYVFNNKLWAVVQASDLSYHFATSTNGVNWDMLTGALPANFPVRGFASLSFATRTGKPKVLVLGGYSANDEYLKSNFSSEDCKYWINFSSENSIGRHSLDSLAPGSSIISYDNKLLLFGAVEKAGLMTGNYYRQSIDEGLSWQVTDTTYNQIREAYVSKVSGTERDTIMYNNFPVRSFQSVVVNNSSQIFIVGGKSNTKIMLDIWTGKLNRKSFVRQ